MKLYLITLTISLIALYTFIKQSYKYASVQDEVDEYSKELHDFYHYFIRECNEPPIDYESDKYKEAETWFTGVGRH